jgi:hypothetical protein
MLLAVLLLLLLFVPAAAMAVADTVAAATTAALQVHTAAAYQRLHCHWLKASGVHSETEPRTAEVLVPAPTCGVNPSWRVTAAAGIHQVLLAC